MNQSSHSNKLWMVVLVVAVGLAIAVVVALLSDSGGEAGEQAADVPQGERPDEAVPPVQVDPAQARPDVPPTSAGESPPPGVEPSAGKPAAPPTPPGVEEELPPGVPPAVPPPKGPEPGGRPDVPPSLGQTEPPPSMPAQVHQMVRRYIREGGPTAGPMAEQLLESDDPLLRSVGAALLGELSQLDEDTLRELAADEDPYVPLTVLGWLRDTNHAEDADLLASLLVGSTMETEALVGYLHAGTLQGGAGRAVLDVLAERLSPDDAMGLYATVADDSQQEYSMRMKATLLLRDTLDFENYREAVSELHQSTEESERLWSEGLARLTERLAGPAQIHQGPPALRATDVDLMLAREYPQMLEDLALWVEYVLAHDDSVIQIGTSQRLQEHIERLERQPWTGEQSLSLRRLQTARDRLSAVEQARGMSIPSDAPPGAGR